MPLIAEAVAAGDGMLEDFRLLVESVEDYAIFMLDVRGQVLTWNRGAQRIKGYEASEIVGRHLSAFYTREDIADGKPERLLEAAVREGRVEDDGWRIRKDGTRFWANVILTALRDGAGRLRGFGKVTRDLTERRHAEKRNCRYLRSEWRARLSSRATKDCARNMSATGL